MGSEGDGTIPKKSSGTVLQSLSQDPTEDELRNMIEELDPDGTGYIDFPDFLTLMAKSVNRNDQEQEFLEAFKVFDPAGTGFISSAFLQHVMVNLGMLDAPRSCSKGIDLLVTHRGEGQRRDRDRGINSKGGCEWGWLD